MHIHRDLSAFRKLREAIPASKSLGFVPTMGHLHAGHASLMRQSQQENDLTLVSIFVNPTQFNQSDDFKNYPRTIETDLAFLEELGIDNCLLPTEAALYSDGYRYQVQENQLSQTQEGAHRPGHFTGVLTVVMKLFHLVRPNRAYFGEKDFQQAELIRGMTEAFFMPIHIKTCPTIREPSGLAYSSRNQRLTPKERLKADHFARIFHQNSPCSEIIAKLSEQGILVEYVKDHENRRFAAVRIGEIRLIDNYVLTNAASK